MSNLHNYHNQRDLQEIDFLTQELKSVREVVLEMGGSVYDPTESVAENVRFMRNVAQALAQSQARQISELKSKIQALELEKNSEKSDPTGGYPVDPADFGLRRR